MPNVANGVAAELEAIQNEIAAKQGGGLITWDELKPLSIADLGIEEGFREVVEDESFNALVESIKTKGILNPIVVVDGKVICGRRRLAAAKKAGLTTVPANTGFVADEASKKPIALLDNFHRKDLNAVEVAKGLKALIDIGFITNMVDAAELLNVTPERIGQIMALLDLPEFVQTAVKDDQISPTAAIQLRDADEDTVRKLLDDAALTGRRVTINAAREQRPAPTPANSQVIPASELPEGCVATLYEDKLVLRLTIHKPDGKWKKGEVGAFLTAQGGEMGDKLEGQLKKILTDWE